MYLLSLLLTRSQACHPMLLTHAQGVSTSFEDAVALELFLADIPPSHSVDSPPSETLLERLQQIEKFRLPRVAATQILTEPIAPGPSAAENFKKQEAAIRQHYSGPLPATGSMPHSPPICQFFFAYDVRKEAIQFMQENPISALPQPPAPFAAPVAVPAQVSAPKAADLTTSSQPAVTKSVEPPTQVSDAQAMAVYEEAQNALAAAQTALVQVTQTLAAAQHALNLATRNLKIGHSQQPQVPPKTQQQKQKPQPPTNTVVAQGQASPNPPAKPRRLKSFDSMKSRMAAVGQKMSRGVSVKEKEVRDSSPEKASEKQTGRLASAHP